MSWQPYVLPCPFAPADYYGLPLLPAAAAALGTVLTQACALVHGPCSCATGVVHGQSVSHTSSPGESASPQ